MCHPSFFFSFFFLLHLWPAPYTPLSFFVFFVWPNFLPSYQSSVDLHLYRPSRNSMKYRRSDLSHAVHGSFVYLRSASVRSKLPILHPTSLLSVSRAAISNLIVLTSQVANCCSSHEKSIAELKLVFFLAVHLSHALLLHLSRTSSSDYHIESPLLLHAIVD